MARWSDPYGKGWEQGRKDAANDLKVTLVRMLPSLSVTLSTGDYVEVEDILALADLVKDPNFHPERTHQ